MRAMVKGLIVIAKILIIGGPLISFLIVIPPHPLILAGAWIERLMPLPPLVRDVEGFEKRLSTAFPIGSPEIDLINRLKDEGFEPDKPWVTGKPDQPWLTEELASAGMREIHRWPCLYRFRVGWRADIDGNISAISGRVQPTCL